MEDLFTDIGLGEEEPTLKGPPPQKKKKTRSKARMAYKYPRTGKYFEGVVFALL